MKQIDEGRIDIRPKEDGVQIVITDRIANTVIAEAHLTPEQFCEALSHVSKVKCNVLIGDVNRIGKKHENEMFEFKLPEGTTIWSREELDLRALAQSQLENGWIADGYFGSQNSFFEKDGEPWARCTVRRWVKYGDN
jgi:hypothetical protein